MATLLARKSGTQDNAIATDDDHHTQLASDPAVSAFPQGSSFGASNGFGSQTTFSSPTGGFGNSAGTVASGTSMSANGNFGTSPSVQQPNNAATLANTGGAMQEGADVLVHHDKESSDWINKKWRPMMGWMYMATCTADFILFPVLWSLLQALSKGAVTSQWQPLTLQGAGLYHIAMGAVLGIAAYGRTKEKVEGKA